MRLVAQERNEVGSIDETKFGRDRTDGIRNDLFALFGIFAFFHRNQFIRVGFDFVA